MTQSPCCWKAKWVTLTDLCKSSQDGLGQLPWPGQNWEWEVLWLGTGEITPGLTDSSYNNNSGSSHHSNSTEVQKTHNLQMYEGHFRSKMCWNASATSWKGFVGGNPEPSLSGEVRSGSSSTQHPGTSRECLVHWLQSKDNTLDCPCRLQSAAQAGTESHFTFLNNSETNTQTQTYFGHSQTKSGPRRRKKRSILLTPNWFYDSMVRHYSTSLSDIHDLILQKLPHFLGQSPNIIFSLTLGKQE